MPRLIFLLLLLFVSPPFFFSGEETQEEPKVTDPLSDAELSRYQYCKSDSDCVKANNGCCDCANGGFDVAVSRERLDELKARFSCEKTLCTMLAKVPPCGTGYVSCVSGKCKFFPEEAFQNK